ncbi:hypothetical protein BURMUCF1_A1807 [Burkholderia multivorans ATCC BAA-247]|uniref:Uncharacterized protein n=1 Tax=Burkholderia multivorans CGD2 TaxID=513052 RepID=B9BL83_9BURK|nr:hypothetical protein BURMUCGD2_5841 [Burkholderia multivorans CGD2]EEE16386.1 hypothetical protein BURMUCGD2M_5831 [Burkholderia multivorans CGD2M]EJO60934.1 hypothetical protein BURMUCF1_A1807 [Burkholderia multivorans ATCC BAA-247]
MNDLAEVRAAGGHRSPKRHPDGNASRVPERKAEQAAGVP